MTYRGRRAKLASALIAREALRRIRRKKLVDSGVRPSAGEGIARTVAITGAIVSVATVLVSVLSVIRSERSATAALEVQRVANAQSLQVQREIAGRDIGLRLAAFLSDHQEELFSDNSQTRERLKTIITISYPESVYWGAFQKLARSANLPRAVRQTFATVPAKPLPQDSIFAAEVPIRVSDEMGNRVRGYDVYVEPDSFSMAWWKPRYLGDSFRRLLVVPLRPGTYQVWAQRRIPGSPKFASTRFLILDAGVAQQTIQLTVPFVYDTTLR